MKSESKKQTMDRSVVRNRRLRYCQTVLETGEYFSEAEMRRRDPSGWTHYIGERHDEEECGAAGLGEWFMSAMEKQQQRFVEAAQNRVEQQVEEGLTNVCDLAREEVAEAAQETSVAERLGDLREMHRVRFIAGEDVWFDYSAVDEDEQWDDVRQRRIDDEEKWFDRDD